MRRIPSVLPALLLVCMALVPAQPANAQERPDLGYFEDVLDLLFDDPPLVGPGILNEYLKPVVTKCMNGETPLLEIDADVIAQRTAGAIRVARAWLKCARKTARDAFNGQIDYASFSIAPLLKKQGKRLDAEGHHVDKLENDLSNAAEAIEDEPRILVKSLLKAQNRVLAKFLRDGNRSGFAWAVYTSIALATSNEIDDALGNAEDSLADFEETFDGPENKHSKKARRKLGAAIDKLHDLQGEPARLIHLWELVGSKLASANALDPGGARNALQREARQGSQAHKKGWRKLLNALFHALTLIEQGEKAIDKAEIGKPDPSDEAIPSGFPATVDPGDYYVMVYVNNGTGTGYIPNAWQFSRVGDGKETIASREQLWDRMRTIVTNAESAYEQTFLPLYVGALAFDSRGAPDGTGGHIPIEDRLAADGFEVGFSITQDWVFTDDISYPEWDGYEGTRQYRNSLGAISMRIKVGFIRKDTPPLVQSMQDSLLAPGNYQLYHSLVLGPLVNGEVHIPARTVQVAEAVDLYDELLAEMETLRVNFQTTFQGAVDPADVAEIQRRHMVVNDCGPPTYTRPIVDSSSPTFILLTQNYICRTEQFPSAARVTVGFATVGN